MTLDLEFSNAATSADITRLRDYLMIEKTNLVPADLILVFGNRHVIEQTAERAAKLYYEGMAPIIVASGGKPGFSGFSEAYELRSALLKHGVPDECILIEDRASNSQENVLFTRDLFQNPEEVSAIIGVGNIVAGRRFLMTLQKNWPEALPMCSHVWPQENLGHTWQKHTEFCEMARIQLARIPHYIAEGFISEIDLDDINRRVLERRATPHQTYTHTGIHIS